MNYSHEATTSIQGLRCQQEGNNGPTLCTGNMDFCSKLEVDCAPPNDCVEEGAPPFGICVIWGKFRGSDFDGIDADRSEKVRVV